MTRVLETPPPPLDISKLDKALEVVVLLRAGEAGHARDHRKGWAFSRREDKRRLDAMTVGMLDALAHTLGKRPDIWQLLVYLRVLVDHGPGARARKSWAQCVQIAERAPELRPYVAGGRRLLLRMLVDRSARPGLFSELLEQELQQL